MTSPIPFPLQPVEVVEADASFPLSDLLRTRRTPLLLKGFAEDWPAIQRWNFPFLRSHFSGRDLHVSWSEERIFPGQRGGALDQGVGGVESSLRYRKLPADEIFTHLEAPESPCYLQALPIPDEPALLGDLPFEPARSKEFQPLLWISSAGHVTPTHFDANEVLFVQVHGRKRFALFPPPAFGNLYPYGVDHPQARYSRLLDLKSPDLERFPQAAGLQGYEAVLEPGSLLFMPNFWWHAVFTETPSVSVSFLSNQEPLPRFGELMGYWQALHELLVQSLPPELPPAMRVYVLRLLLFPPQFSKEG